MILLLTSSAGLIDAGEAEAQLAPIDISVNVTALLRAPRSILLDVSVNGQARGAARRFTLTPPHQLAAEKRVLEAIGIAVERDGPATSLIDLDTLAGVSFQFDQDQQAIAFTVAEGRLMRRIHDAHGTAVPVGALTPGWGAFLNYSVFASEGAASSWLRFTGANAALDARLFTPYGVVENSQLVGTTLGSTASNVRLETSYTVSDPDLMMTGRIGDTITGGLAWTRPVRLGGIQVQRDFTLQPALVTQPLPTFAGSAAVPSTVDVFVGSAKLMSERVEAGPYQLTNIPSLTNGTGNVVVTDATGRQTASSLALYNVAHLLRPDLTSFSVEAGLVRRSFGTFSDDYDSRPVGSATFGTGLTPLLTLDGHTEVGAGVANAGSGFVFGTPWGTLEGAFASSYEAGRIGAQVYGAYDVQIWGDISLHASAQRRTNAYDDLAGATARWTHAGSTLDRAPSSLANVFDAFLDATSFRPPRRVLELSTFTPVPFLGGTASIGLIDREDGDHLHARLLTASYNFPLPHQAMLFATGFADLRQRGGGILAGITIPFGDDIFASVAGSYGSGQSASLTAQKALGQEAGSVGWQIADDETGQPSRVGNVAYRSGFGTVAFGARQEGRIMGTTASLDGSIATMGGEVAMGNRVQDSFAIIDAGLPNVEVLQDNRPVGTTDPWGHLVLPALSPFQPNRIAVDPLSLQDSATLATSESVVVPGRSSGVRVAFGGDRNAQARTIYLSDADGRPLQAGGRGMIEGSGESFVIGYGGVAYVRHLAEGGTAIVQTHSGACHVVISGGSSSSNASRHEVFPCS